MKRVILLTGPQGSGKSTYCTERLQGYTRISQDEMGKDGHKQEYHAALKRGDELVVVDRINHTREQRGNYLALARQFNYQTKIVWFNVDRNTCTKRIKERKNHPTLGPDKADEALNFFFKAFQTPSKKEANELEVIGQKPYYVKVKDITEEIGSRRFIIVGDIHGCHDELRELLASRNFNEQEDVLISVGDIIDRGPKIKETVDYCLSLKHFYMVCGNHEDKALRYFTGNKVKVANGLQATIDAFGGKLPDNVKEFMHNLPLIIKTPHGYVVHAGFDPLMSAEEQQKSDCIYMRYYGGKTYFDSINGQLWYDLWPKEGQRVFFGHIPDVSGPCTPSVVSLDGGCVFGNYLKAYDSLDGVVYYQNAKATYSVSEYAEATENAVSNQVSKREEYVIAGLLRSDKTDDGQLAIYTYTDQCVYDGAWDDITRNSRGHIYDLTTGKRVACAMPKFFNLGENQETRFENFDWTKPYDVYEKMDGWLGILYRHERKYKVASRGSFHSSGSAWATEHIQKFDLSCVPECATLVFEIISKDHKIILDYHEDTLVILTAYDYETGKEYPRKTVEEWASKIGLPIVKRHEQMTIEDCIALQKTSKDREGFVILMSDGRRVKVKIDWYMQIAKLMANLSPITIWEAMKNGKVQTEYLLTVPEEFRPVANGYTVDIEKQYVSVYAWLLEKGSAFAAKYNNDCKQIGLNVKDLEGSLLRKAVFAVVKSNTEKLDRIVLDAIYPSGNEFVSLKKLGIDL